MAEIADAAVEIHGDTAPFDRDMDSATRKAKRAGDQAGKAHGKAFAGAQRDELDRFVAGAGSSGGKAGKSYGARFKKAVVAANIAGTLGAALTLLTSQAIQLGGSLVPLTGLLAGLPGVLSIGGAAAGTMKVALLGVSDAFSAAASGDAEEFAESLENLSPAAQAVVRDFRAMVPQLQDVRSAVQDAFFGPLQGQLARVAANLSGPVQAGMVGVAAAFGDGARAVADFLSEAETARTVDAIFASTGDTIRGMSAGLDPLLTGIRDLIDVTIGGMGGIGESIGGVMNRFGQWLTQISESGQALEWLDAGTTALQQFGSLLWDVGGIFVGIFRAMSVTGEGVLGTLGALAGAASAFLNSAEGQANMVAMFAGITTVGNALQSVLLVVLGALGSILGATGELAVALGPALDGFVTGFSGLGPLADGVAAGISAIAQAISTVDPTVLDRLGVALGVVAAAALSAKAAMLGWGVAKGVWAAMTPVVTILTGALRALKIVFVALNVVMRANPVGLIITAITLLIAGVIWLWNNVEGFRNFWIGAWAVLSSAAIAAATWLVNAWNNVAAFFTGLGASIGAAVTGIITWFQQLPGRIGAFFAALPGMIGSFLATALSTVVGWATSLGALLVSGITTAAQGILAFFVALPGQIGAFLAALPGVLWNLLVGALTNVARGLGIVIGTILALIIGIPILIGTALFELGQIIVTGLTNAWAWAVMAISNGITTAAAFFVALPGRIFAALAMFGVQLAAWGAAAWAWLSSTWNAAVAATVAWFAAIPGRIEAAVDALGGLLAAWGTAAWNMARNAFNAGINGIISFVSGLPGRIVSALGSLGSLLYNAGSEIIGGFLDGLRSSVGAVFDFVGGIADQVAALKGPLPYDRVLLVPHGRAIMGGLDRGLRSEFGTVRKTLTKMTRDIPAMTVPVRTSGMGALRTTELAAAARLGGVVNRQRSSSRTVHVNAPITVQTNTANPQIAARLAADRVALMAQA